MTFIMYGKKVRGLTVCVVRHLHITTWLRTFQEGHVRQEETQRPKPNIKTTSIPSAVMMEYRRAVLGSENIQCPKEGSKKNASKIDDIRYFVSFFTARQQNKNRSPFLSDPMRP